MIFSRSVKRFIQIVIADDGSIDAAQRLQVFEPALGILIQSRIDDGQRGLVCEAFQQKQFTFRKIARFAVGKDNEAADQLVFVFHVCNSHGVKV